MNMYWCIDVLMNEWMTEWMNEWMNEKHMDATGYKMLQDVTSTKQDQEGAFLSAAWQNFCQTKALNISDVRPLFFTWNLQNDPKWLY